MRRKPRVMRPQAGPQMMVAATPADIAIMGGSAGGGKSFSLLLEAGRVASMVPRSSSVIIRRTTTMLRGAGGLWDKSFDFYPYLGGKPLQGNRLVWKFPNGAQIEFTHFQHQKNEDNYQGRELDFAAFDEITQFDAPMFWYVWSRMRSMYNIRPYIRATCNPDPDSFVKKLIEWYLDEDGRFAIPERSGKLRWFVRPAGELVWGDDPRELKRKYNLTPKSFTFIRSALDDNPALMKADPEYYEKLQSLPLVKRRQLLEGDWNIKAGGGNVFRREWFPVEPSDRLGFKRIVRAWDLAATEPSPENPDPDWTVGALVGQTHNGYLVVLDIVRQRATPGRVEALVEATARQDGPGITQCFWQDPGQAGKSQIGAFRRRLGGLRVDAVVSKADKLTYAYVWSALAEPRDGDIFGRVMLCSLISKQERNAFLNEAQAFPEGGHDDQIDAVSLAAVVLLEAQPLINYQGFDIDDL